MNIESRMRLEQSKSEMISKYPLLQATVEVDDAFEDVFSEYRKSWMKLEAARIDNIIINYLDEIKEIK